MIDIQHRLEFTKFDERYSAICCSHCLCHDFSLVHLRLIYRIICSFVRSFVVILVYAVRYTALNCTEWVRKKKRIEQTVGRQHWFMQIVFINCFFFFLGVFRVIRKLIADQLDSFFLFPESLVHLQMSRFLLTFK